MELNMDIISEIIKGNNRFISAYSDPEPYFMYSRQNHSNKSFDAEIIEYYYDKLRYAVQNAITLIEEAFREEYFDFYGVNKTAVSSPKQMCSNLIFESFTLDIDDMSVGAYLSNKHFMPGHFIEAHWDSEWKLSYVWID